MLPDSRFAVLRAFRLKRAIGGHAHDGDALVLHLPFESDAALAALLGRLGLTHEPTKSSAGTWRDPGMTTIAGVRTYVSLRAGAVELQVGRSYEVSGEDVDDAATVERALAEAGLLPRAD